MDVGKFISSLVNYDKDNIPANVLKKLNVILAKPEFDKDEIAKKVSYAGDLAGFCTAMKIYSEVNEKVAPKKALVAELMKEVAEADDKLNKANSQL